MKLAMVRLHILVIDNFNLIVSDAEEPAVARRFFSKHQSRYRPYVLARVIQYLQPRCTDIDDAVVGPWPTVRNI